MRETKYYRGYSSICLFSLRHKQRNFPPPPFACVEIIMILNTIHQRFLFFKERKIFWANRTSYRIDRKQKKKIYIYNIYIYYMWSRKRKFSNSFFLLTVLIDKILSRKKYSESINEVTFLQAPPRKKCNGIFWNI